MHVLKDWNFEAGALFIFSNDPDLGLLVHHFEELPRGIVSEPLVTQVLDHLAVRISYVASEGQLVQDAATHGHDVEAQLDLLLLVDVLQVEEVVFYDHLCDEPIEPSESQ